MADGSFHAIGTRTVKSTNPRGGITVSIFLYSVFEALLKAAPRAPRTAFSPKRGGGLAPPRENQAKGSSGTTKATTE